MWVLDSSFNGAIGARLNSSRDIKVWHLQLQAQEISDLVVFLRHVDRYYLLLSCHGRSLLARLRPCTRSWGFPFPFEACSSTPFRIVSFVGRSRQLRNQWKEQVLDSIASDLNAHSLECSDYSPSQHRNLRENRKQKAHLKTSSPDHRYQRQFPARV